MYSLLSCREREGDSARLHGGEKSSRGRNGGEGSIDSLNEGGLVHFSFVISQNTVHFS